MVGKIYLRKKNNKLYLAKRTIPNIEKTKFYVEFYQITIKYQKIPSFDSGHFFPKRLNKNVTFIQSLEDFESEFREAEEIDMIPLPE
jgi:hypothetical protein